MTNWLNAGWKPFLNNRMLLYEVIEVCSVFPGAGTPTRYLGLDQYYADWICVEIDKGLAQYKLWYESRKEARQKVGKYKWDAKHKTLADVLGITEQIRRGGWNDGSELTTASKSYQQAVMAAARAGLPPPNPDEWLAAYKAGEID